MSIPSSDQQTAPTRADLATQNAAGFNEIEARLATLTAAVLNVQAAITALDARLTAAGLEVEPNVFSAILSAARTD